MNCFSVLGVPAAAGWSSAWRFRASGRAAPLLVLSHGFWTRRFNRDSAVVGRTVTISAVHDGRRCRRARVPRCSVLAPDVWVPATMIPVLDPESQVDFSPTNRRSRGSLMMGGRLAPGVSRQQASAEVETIGRVLEREHEETRVLSPLGMPPPRPMVWRVASASLIPLACAFQSYGFLALLMGSRPSCWSSPARTSLAFFSRARPCAAARLRCASRPAPGVTG